MRQGICPAEHYTLPTVEFVGGSTQKFGFRTYFQTKKNPYDLSACTAYFSVIHYVNKTGEPILSKEMEIDESSQDSGVQNLLKVTLLPEETADLSGKFIYQITIQNASDEVEIPDQGLLYIYRNIDRERISG